MKTYIGTKIIQAEPALRVGGEIISPHDILPEDVSVEEGYRVKYPDGYESWSPKGVFEQPQGCVRGSVPGDRRHELRPGH